MGFNVKRWYVGRRRRRVPTDLPVLVWMNSRPLEKWKSVYPAFCVRKTGHFTFDSLKINTKTKKHKLSKGYFCSCIFLCDQCCLVSKNIFYIPCDGLFKLFLNLEVLLSVPPFMLYFFFSWTFPSCLHHLHLPPKCCLPTACKLQGAAGACWCSFIIAALSNFYQFFLCYLQIW